jgi:hypothetical protein
LATEKFIHIRKEKSQKRGNTETEEIGLVEINHGKVKGISGGGRERDIAAD